MFNIFKYIRNVSATTFYKMISRWEEDRGGMEYEAIFDLNNKEDFVNFVNNYGVQKTIYYYNKGRFYYDGMNFNVPKPTNVTEMASFIANEIDLDYFKHCINDFGTMNHWGDLVDVQKIKELIAKEDKHDYRAEVLLYGNREEINSVITALRNSDVVKGLEIQRV